MTSLGTNNQEIMRLLQAFAVAKAFKSFRQSAKAFRSRIISWWLVPNDVRNLTTFTSFLVTKTRYRDRIFTKMFKYI